jgi:uncharacterized protein (DUF736 family)
LGFRLFDFLEENPFAEKSREIPLPRHAPKPMRPRDPWAASSRPRSGGLFKRKETLMSTIGTFTKNGDRFDGNLRTLNLNLPAVSFVPVDRRDNENAPNYRAFYGQAEFGAAWTKESKNQDTYLSVLLDDPGMSAPISCALVQAEGNTWHLVWSRPNK